MKYDFVFVVLVYRNTQDLKDFFCSLKIPNTKVVVVNSFFDEETEKEFKQIAESNNADFLSVPNRGYGAGNNSGVEFVLQRYDFKYLVISNADIIIQNMSVKVLDICQAGIYAPSIHTLSGKQQNPHMPYHIKLIDRLKYNFFLHDNWRMIILFCAINKVFRILFLSITRHFNGGKIYSAHGSFVILPKSVLQKLAPLYDEDVFLFTEEENLALNARAHGVCSYFIPEIKITHKEDGSTAMISDRQRDLTRDSFVKFYQKWYK